jgi:hypothetical protein
MLWMFKRITGALIIQAALSGASTMAAIEQEPPHSVMELRQYKIVEGQREAFIKLFERAFVETQEATGMRLLGQFSDLDDQDRFTWMRSFANMKERERALNEFYYGPAWAANREKANPMLVDNDNVLLLKPVSGRFALAPAARARGATGKGLVVVTIHYLWKDPNEGFSRFFEDEFAPLLEKAGLPVLGAYVPEATENSFPRLPVRQREKLFVWITRLPSAEAYEAALMRLDLEVGHAAVVRRLTAHEERRAQTLRLQPTARSCLR